MKRTALGAEITAFYQEQWPETIYMDFGDGLDILDENGKPLLDPTKKYNLNEFDALCRQDTDASHIGFFEGVLDFTEDSVSFAEAFNIWRKNIHIQTMVVTIPKGDIDAFKEYADKHKWKIH